MSRILLLSILLAAAPALGCERPERETVLAKAATGSSLRWDFADASSLLAPASLSGASLRHAEWVRRNTRMSARENLENHIRVGAKLAGELSPGDPFLAQISKSRRNVERILRGEAGVIQPIRCLELLPFEEFLKKVDLRSFAGELIASVLVKGGRAVILGDYYRIGMEGGAQETRASLRERAKLLKQGWRLEASLHNHPFSFGNPYGDIGGTLGPSDPDLAGYRQLKPAFAVITNGIDTIAMPRAGYEKLE